MQVFSKVWTTAVCLTFVAACSQTEAPQPIQAEPIFNKYGDVIGCSDGSSPAGTATEPCVPPPPPPEGCDDSSVAGTASVPCTPPGEERDPSDSSTSGGGRDPDGGRDPSDSTSTGDGRDPTGGSSAPGTPRT
ncbi:hypothetical protein [Ruegeria lacuscaerulensis]|uniref:hypothetical protein n=1 Tax=Ruegeria lacuscaerulensis TaxID=55218 RepID=UPI00147A9D5B|nr:hypothetical protein [Ruegeria lacuscaerulensis]